MKAERLQNKREKKESGMAKWQQQRFKKQIIFLQLPAMGKSMFDMRNQLKENNMCDSCEKVLGRLANDNMPLKEICFVYPSRQKDQK